MPLVDEKLAKKRLLDWLYAINPLIQLGEISANTPLLKEGVLNSIQLMELIIYIERLTERPIEIDALKSSSFKNVDSIFEHFFKEQSHELR